MRPHFHTIRNGLTFTPSYARAGRRGVARDYKATCGCELKAMSEFKRVAATLASQLPWMEDGCDSCGGLTVCD